jgi:hypothetical protein
MQRWLLLTVALAGAGCATTTVGAGSNDPARRLADPNGAPDATPASPEQPSEPEVVVTATSPTDVQFSTGGNDTVVPLTPVPWRTPTRRRVWVQHGMLFGAAIGAALGVIDGSAADRRDSERGAPECDPLCGGHVLVDSLGLAALGLGVGAAAGAIIGLFDSR